MDWNLNKVHELEDIYYDPNRNRDLYDHEEEEGEDETDNY